MKIKQVSYSDRRWARKQFQNALGTFSQHSCGLYLSPDVPSERTDEITTAFTSAPAQLQELALEHELTLNVAYFGSTSNDDVCTMFGVSESGPISPHLEIGRSAFGPNLKPYVVHELCHLWWRVLPGSARNLYRDFLVSNTAEDCFEVTEYAHSKFAAYLERKANVANLSDAQSCIQIVESTWVVESFCETVAMIWVPDYKSSEDWISTVDLGQRKVAIREIAGIET